MNQLHDPLNAKCPMSNQVALGFDCECRPDGERARALEFARCLREVATEIESKTLTLDEAMRRLEIIR